MPCRDLIRDLGDPREVCHVHDDDFGVVARFRGKARCRADQREGAPDDVSTGRVKLITSSEQEVVRDRTA